MSNLSLFLLLLFVGLITYGITKIALIYALKNELIDKPDHRSSHKNNTPRGGGISIVIVFLLFIIAMIYWDDSKLIESTSLFSILTGGAIVALLGYWDDHQHIPAKYRILFQLLAALISLYFLTELPTISFFSLQVNLIEIPFFTIVLVWLLNLYNFMDGIDGIASVEAIFVLVSASLILYSQGGDEAFLLIILAASVSGFLLWNWPPARIFMGDTCSGFLGFILGLLAIITSLDGAINLWSWLILLGAFVVDATYTLFRRVLRGDKWYEAHRSHTYQILTRRYNSHKKVTLGVLMVNTIWLFPLAYLASIYEYWAPLLSLIAFLPLILLAYRVKAGIVND